MKIGPVDRWGPPPAPEDDSKRNVPVRPEEEGPKTEADRDSVEISSMARVKADQAVPADAAQPPAENQEDDAAADESATRPEKIEEARQRMESGYYDKPEVRQEIARRITDDFVG